MTTYITTAIPFVNAAPHLGHALELVQVDAIARWHRQRGRPVRSLTGTDDNALKNVHAANAAGHDVASFVADSGDRFVALAGALDCAFDDVIRTAFDPRHRPGVERLWRACADAGDLELRRYDGRYCAGCEAFVDDRDLVDGRCVEHLVVPEPVSEANWFFRLSRHADAIGDAIANGRLQIVPEQRTAEVLAWCADGVPDLSVSRPAQRAGGWGIPVPGDPSQVVYVWFDALANYVTALGYGTGDGAFDRWWTGSNQRVHVVGKGIVRFHALIWPAILASAGLAWPTTIAVHDYLTTGGQKLSKSLGNAVDAATVVERHGADAVRWWLLRAVPPVGDADFTDEALVARADAELANGIGNVVSRVVALVRRCRGGIVPGGPPPSSELVERIDAAIARFDLRAATGALVDHVGALNRSLERDQPWVLAKAERAGDRAAGQRLDEVLSIAVGECRQLAQVLAPFAPALAARATALLVGTGARRGHEAVLYPRSA
jgi:methionyl-tRNA synthetase